MTARKTLDQMNSNDLDQLHARAETAEKRLRLAHQARRAKEHQLDDIRRALCDVGFMDDDDPYSHADLADVIRQTPSVLERAEAALARVRALAADMRGSSDTRWFADQLTAALAEPAPTASPAATQATEADDPGPDAPATITDPEWLRQQYAEAMIHTIEPFRNLVAPELYRTVNELAAAVLRVRDRHLQQLRQRLQLADQAHREDADTVRRAERQRDQLAGVLREVLANLLPRRNEHDTVFGYEPVYPIKAAVVDRWRAALDSKEPAP